MENLDEHFKIVRSHSELPSNPWNPEGAPLWIESKGHQIEQWTINDNRIAGELSQSPVHVNQLKLEPITLIPYGCTTLRVTEFPVVSTSDDAIEWTSNEPRQLFQASASHCFSGDTVDAIGDSVEPDSSADGTIPRMTFWDHKGTAEWCDAKFDEPRVFDESSIYWFDDTGSGECRVPKNWRLLYRKDDEWVPVKTAFAYEAKRDRFNKVSFDPVRTDAFRLEVQLQETYSAGILEWRIYKSSR